MNGSGSNRRASNRKARRALDRESNACGLQRPKGRSSRTDKAILIALVDCTKEFNDRKDVIVVTFNKGNDEYLQEKNGSNCEKPEENDQIVGEVMKIKEILSKKQLYKSESILFEFL
ncbi:hypothetical protein IEQ34_011774 [Dendrobium chrysotoxum]|uniref:Uncharacterized protein n=1 Tax=Dendrobium chrysotoxum TaxID=161865 RepID=A0AAV7GUM4_DENCH|nr:hypothetical protein IEQ34_011774 [Dendrobium chrysotoxum]